MMLLIKYPSRGRPIKFFEGLQSIYNNTADLENMRIICTLDEDDATMNNSEVREQIALLPNLEIKWGLSESKVHAFNRDMPQEGWDICMAMSDDMRLTHYGYDQFIKSCFVDSLDWLLHLPDQDEKDKLPVLYIAGITFYRRSGNIYPPCYKSLFCDTETMHVAKALGRYKFENIPGLFVHLLAAYGHSEPDEQWLIQQQIGWTVDQNTFLERQANNFYL